jgi:hypothetical protein
MNAPQAGMRDGAAHEGNLAHSRKTNITDILASSAQEAIVLLAAKPRADCFLRQFNSPTNDAD